MNKKKGVLGIKVTKIMESNLFVNGKYPPIFVFIKID